MATPRIIGILYDIPEAYSDYPSETRDQFAEFEPESTITFMESVIRALGHKSLRITSPKAMLRRRPQVDLIWNISEGLGTRNREAWGPVLAELHRIPMIGSDALTLSISLDKVLTKKLARYRNIPTADWTLYRFDKSAQHIDHSADSLQPPLLLKPRYEGTAKGISREAIVKQIHDLERKIAYLHNAYQQDLFAEPLLTGAEFTCAVIGQPLTVLPVLERGVDQETGLGIHVLEQHGEQVDDYSLTENLTTEEESQIQQWCLELCEELEIRHFARFDFKRDSKGQLYFLEVNPLPTFAINSTFAIYAELEGVDYTSFMTRFIAEIIQSM